MGHGSLPSGQHVALAHLVHSPEIVSAIHSFCAILRTAGQVSRLLISAAGVWARCLDCSTSGIHLEMRDLR
jgi:hypothetical protein